MQTPKSIANHNLRISTVAIFVIISVIGYFTFNKGIPFILNWDLFGHHAYLANLFHNGTLDIQDLSFFEGIQKQYENTNTLYQFVLLENGHFMIKYTSGWAILMTPFYAIAEVWARIGNYPSDGFSYPYQTMIAIGAFSYFIAGIFVLRKVLAYFFKDKLVAVLLILVVFGTNFFFMQFASLGISHNLEFFLVSLLLLFTIKFHQEINLKNGIILGVIVGFIGLVRPPDLILTLIPIAWNLNDFGGFFGKIRHFIKFRKWVLFATIFAFLITFSPQFIYWKLVSGSFVVNSYANNLGEGFDWFTPYILEVLFSFKKGWLLYTSLMFFAICGFYFWIKKALNGFTSLIVFLIFLYVVSCWTTWWYAESFSQRALLDIYPLLTIALGFFILRIKESKFSWFFAGLISLSFLFNLFQTYQMTLGILHGSRITKDYYFSTFGQISGVTDYQKSLLSIDRGTMNEFDFKDDNFKKCYQKYFHFKSDFQLDSLNQYTPTIDLPPSKISSKSYFWVVARWKYEGKAEDLKGKFFTMAMKHGNGFYAWRGISVEETIFHLDTVKKEALVSYITPNFRSKKDIIRIDVFNQNGKKLKILGVKLEAYEPLVDREKDF